jgi:hypothetical protein
MLAPSAIALRTEEGTHVMRSRTGLWLAALSLTVTALVLPVGAHAAQLPDVVVRSTWFTGAQGGEGTASCNAGEVATGGGVGVDITGATYVARSQPLPGTGAPTAWNGVLRERADGSAGQGTVYVICARPTGDTLPDVVVRSTWFTGAQGGEGTASCNAGEVATGGGVGVDITGATYVARSQPLPGTGAPTAWNAVLRERADGSAGQGTVYVICARPPATSPPVATPPPVTTPAPVTTVSPTPLVLVQLQHDVVYFPRDGLRVNHEWLAFERYTRLQKLTVTGMPAGAGLALLCRGRGCPFAGKALAFPNGGKATLAKLFAHGKLRIKTVVELRITAPNEVGKLVRFTMRRRRPPRVSALCLPTGAQAPRDC